MWAWVRDERSVVGLVAAASAIALFTWGGETRPMEDSVGYRSVAAVLRAGWHEMPDRSPGYPLVLLATGADRRESAVLFLVQLVAHGLAVFVVVDLAKRLGVGPRWRLAIAVLLVAPPVLMKAVYTGTEVWAELALVMIAWLLVRWDEQRRTSLLVAVGTIVGAVTWFRPTYQLLVLPLAIPVAVMARRRPGNRAVRAVAALVAPAVALVGGLIAANAIRFDTPGVDRLLPYHLSEKTAAFVEQLPADEDPTRSILVERRDRLLVEDPEHSAAAFLFDSRRDLERATGRSGADLDREVLRLDLLLIRENPLSYLQAVENASLSYVQVDPQEAGYGGWHPLSWTWSVVHLVLAATFVGFLLLFPGAALVRGLGRQFAVTCGVCWLLVLYNAVVTVTVVTGEPRIRAATDPLLVLLLVSGLWWLTDQKILRWPTSARAGDR